MSISLFDRILVLGSEGQLASSFRVALQKADLLKNTVFLGKSDLDWTLIDSDAEVQIKLMAAFARQKPSLVINTMAYTLVDKAETDKENCIKLNIQAVDQIARFCKKQDSFLVHYSTDYVYPGVASFFHTEENPTGPLNFYGLTKLQGEQKIEELLKHYLIFRTSWVVSPYGNNFVKTMLRLAAEKEELKVVSDQVGAPTSALDLAEGTLEILKKIDRQKQDSKFSGIYHWTNSGTTNWFELAEFIFAEAKKQGAVLKVKKVEPILTSQYQTAAKRPLNSRLSLQKIKNNFDETPRDWKQGVEEIVQSLLHPKAT